MADAPQDYFDFDEAEATAADFVIRCGGNVVNRGGGGDPNTSRQEAINYAAQAFRNHAVAMFGGDPTNYLEVTASALADILIQQEDIEGVMRYFGQCVSQEVNARLAEAAAAAGAQQ